VEVLAFAGLTVLIILVPGPSVLFTIGRALTVGRREALLTVVGNAAGCYLQVIAVAVGVGVIVERSVVVFTVIKLVGAAYLGYLGVQAIRHRGRITEALAAGVPTMAAGRAVRDGLVVGFLNPKTIVFFVVALPQFTDPAAGNAPLDSFRASTTPSVKRNANHSSSWIPACWCRSGTKHSSRESFPWGRGTPVLTSRKKTCACLCPLASNWRWSSTTQTWWNALWTRRRCCMRWRWRRPCRSISSRWTRRNRR